MKNNTKKISYLPQTFEVSYEAVPFILYMIVLCGTFAYNKGKSAVR